MTKFRILNPDEAKKKARAKVEQWKREKKKEALKQKIKGKKLPTEPPQAIEPKKELTREEQERLDIELCRTAEEGMLEKVTELLDRGASVDAVDSAAIAVLKDHALKGHTIMMGNQFYTPLMRAASRGHKDIVELLINRRANINSGDGYCGNTPLMLASWYGHKEVAELLVEKGADVNARTNAGRTSLMHASTNGCKEIVELLVEKGAEVNAEDSMEETALMLASRKEHKEIVEFLKKHGAKK